MPSQGRFICDLCYSAHVTLACGHSRLHNIHCTCLPLHGWCRLGPLPTQPSPDKDTIPHCPLPPAAHIGPATPCLGPPPAWISPLSPPAPPKSDMLSPPSTLNLYSPPFSSWSQITCGCQCFLGGAGGEGEPTSLATAAL